MANARTVTVLLLTFSLRNCYQRTFNERTNYFQIYRFSDPSAILSL